MANVQELSQARAALEPSEHTLALRDGVELFYRAWLPEKPTTKALLLFHRGHEHSGRWQETVASLGLEDVAVFAWDQRGHGRSPGEGGSAPDLATVIHDADEWVRHLTAMHGIAAHDTVVLAHSLGAVIATAWIHDYAPPIRAMILATPAFRVRLYVPLAIPSLRLKQKFLGPSFVKSYVKAKMLTHDPGQAALYDADPLIFRQIAVNVLIDLHDAGEIERAVAAFAGQPNSGLIMIAASRADLHRKLIIALAAKHELPAVYPLRSHVAEGGLLSYGPDAIDQYRRVAGYVDRILKGEKPADLPVQAPTKYELVINLKTAKALGLTVPDMLLARADEVIE
jgi:alpha-beta hydrolase superfamily lysophospholipase